MSIPNALSLLRIFLVAPFLVAVIYRQFALALILCLVAGLSDFLDGFLARRWHQTSALGAYLDPLGDRLLTTVAFVVLAVQGLLPAWLAVTVVAKDLYVALGAAVLYFTGSRFLADASIWGKLATLLQFFTVGMALLASLTSLASTLMDILFLLTGLVTVVACLQYVRQGLQMFSAGGRDG